MKRIQAIGFDLKWNRIDGEYNKLDFRDLFPSQLFGNQRYVFITEDGSECLWKEKTRRNVNFVELYFDDVNKIRLSRGLNIVEKKNTYKSWW